VIGPALLVGGVGTGLLVGGTFGIRHAFEADHVAAVATLVGDERRPVATGASWGVGHSIPIVVVGATFLALDLRVPDGIGMVFELLVAGVLVALGCASSRGGSRSDSRYSGTFTAATGPTRAATHTSHSARVGSGSHTPTRTASRSPSG
jgi:hypothetical protein